MTVEVAYQAIINTPVDPILVPPTVLEEPKKSHLLTWAKNSLYIDDFLDMVFPSDEAILEAMRGQYNTCEDLHHRS